MHEKVQGPLCRPPCLEDGLHSGPYKLNRLRIFVYSPVGLVKALDSPYNFPLALRILLLTVASDAENLDDVGSVSSIH